MKENIIHIKLEYQEALEAKKDILFSEMNLLKIAKKIQKYKELRKEELDLKLNILKKIKETKTEIRKLQRTLPKLEIPEILKKSQENFETKEIGEKVREKQDEDNLEYELKEIQNKLASLQ